VWFVLVTGELGWRKIVGFAERLEDKAEDMADTSGSIRS